MGLLIFYFSLALAVSFLCSLLESVILSITRTHIAIESKEGKKSSTILESLKENINRPLAAILTVNTVANVVGAAGVGAQSLQIFGSKAVAISSAILTISILVFSEIIPKTIGAVYWKKLSGFAAYAIRGLIWVTLPLVYLSEWFYSWVVKDDEDPKVSREEMLAMAEMGEDEGTIEEKEGDIIENLLNLRDVKAEDVMTPRNVVFALSKHLSVKEVMDKYSPIVFSRIPVFENDLDTIIGFVHRYDLVKKQAEDKFEIKMGDIMDPIHTISETESIAFILDEFVHRRQQIFHVVDEFGTTTGIITLEDAIETLLGVEIIDEHDSVVDMRKLASEKWKRDQNTN
jgi:CBS domain containing-hemolysin-like protein